MSGDKKLIIYTDGAALGNPGKGGYGIVMLWGSARKEMSQGYEHTTNNRMELMAVIVALESITRNSVETHIHTDSKYVCDAIEKKWLQNWQRTGWKNKKNVDLWKRFLNVYSERKVRFHWVKGHAGIAENERCDVLATTAAKNGPWLNDDGYLTDKDQQNLL